MTQTFDDGALATLAALLVEEFARGQCVRPALPSGCRDNYVAALTRLLLDPDTRMRYVEQLREAVAAHAVDAALDEVGMTADLPLEKFLDEGFPALSDDDLATLGILEIVLEDVAELIDGERDGHLGEYWWPLVLPKSPYLRQLWKESGPFKLKPLPPGAALNPEDLQTREVRVVDPKESHANP